MNTAKSKELFERSLRVIPGGVNSPVRAYRAVGRTPLFIDHAAGDRIFDADGNEYIDYVCSWGPGILGHAHPQVIEAVQKACEKGLTYGAPTEKELILAQMITEAMPAVEEVRLVNSGTEAVMSAIRAARGYTGRDRIIKFKGCYHGHADGLLVKAGSAALTTAVPDSAGVPKSYTEKTLVALYNDEDSVRSLMEQYGSEVAAIIVEPVAANMGVVLPKKGFLEYLRRITEQYGSLLIFDEVITGFRVAYGGAQGRMGITPDLTTLGKIIGGGMPVGAFGGRADIMAALAPDGPVYQAGTLSGNPIAMKMGLNTLHYLKDHPEVYEVVEARGRQLEEGFNANIAATGVKARVNRYAGMTTLFFTDHPVTDFASVMTSDTELYARYFALMLEAGNLMPPSQFEGIFVSAAHTEEDIARTVADNRRALEALAAR